MEYLLLYVFSIIFTIYMKNKFVLNQREIIELVVLPILMPLTLGILVEFKTFSLEDFIYLPLQLPLTVLFGVLFFLPLLLIPAAVIVKLKQDYKEQPLILFLLSTLMGGLILSITGKWEMIIIGMLFALVSVLIQYYFLDKNRKSGVNNENFKNNNARTK